VIVRVSGYDFMQTNGRRMMREFVMMEEVDFNWGVCELENYLNSNKSVRIFFYFIFKKFIH
jgi:hypothetical protein